MVPTRLQLFLIFFLFFPELTSGEISQYSLWQRLTTPGLSPIERDIITSALNIFNANSNNGNSGLFPKQIQPIGANNLFPQMKPNALSAPIPMPQGSPLSPVPPPMDQHLLFQHQAANKLRLSPLPAAGKIKLLNLKKMKIKNFHGRVRKKNFFYFSERSLPMARS